MVIGLITLGLPLVALAIMFLWGLFIGIRRTRIRFICVAVSFVSSMALAFSVKGMHSDALMKFFSSGKNETLALILGTDGLREALLQCGGAMIAPWVFLIAFVVLCSLSWIICNILFFVFSFGKKNGMGVSEKDFSEEDYADLYDTFGDSLWSGSGKGSVFRVAFYAVAQVLLTFFVIFTPVVSTMDCVPVVIDAVSEIGSLQNEGQGSGMINQDKVLKTVDEFNKSPVISGYRSLGGDKLCRELTTFEIEGEKYMLNVELDVIADFVANIYKLNGKQIQDYTEAEIVILREIDAEMHESVFLPTVAGDLIYLITDGWLDETGSRAVFGMQKPNFDKDTTSMVAEPFDHILEAFHKDAHNLEALRADFDTMEHVMEILINSGVIASMNETETNGMVELLTCGSTIKDLLAEFDKNPSFAPVSDDITRIGMRSMGSTIQISGESEEAYNQFTGDLADSLTQLKAQGLTPEEQKTELTNTIRETYKEQSGQDLELGDDVVEIYADVLIKEFEGKDNVTADDMKQFFDVYAGVQSESSQSSEQVGE